MAPSPENNEDVTLLEAAVNDFREASSVTAKQRPVKATKLAETVATRAYATGLPAGLLEVLLDIVTLPNELDQASTNTVVRSLYPATRVNDDCVLKVVGALGLGQRKPPMSVQVGLLKWLIMVWDVLQNQKVLGSCYSFLFGLLDIAAIRAPLCHLLSLITKRKNVRPFRIQALLELARKAGNEPQLIGLTRVYKDYYPDVIVGEATAGRAFVFMHPNTEWRTRLAEIQEAHAQRSLHVPKHSREAFKVARYGMNDAKRSKVSIVPEVHTSRAHQSSTTLEEIETVSQFVQNFEKINLPNQLVAGLHDPLLQKLLQLKSTVHVEKRMSNWLSALFDSQAQDESFSPEALDVLKTITDYARYTKVIPPACLDFIVQLLPEWDGLSGREIVLDLLSYLPIQPYSDLRARIFKQLEAGVLDNTPASQKLLLDFYTSLLYRWSFALISSSPPSHTASTISKLADHVNLLSHTLIVTSNTAETQNSVLSYYEATAMLIAHPKLHNSIRITVPPQSLIYILNFSSSLATLSRLCAILAIYKRSFEAAMSAHNKSISVPSTPIIGGLSKEHTQEPYAKEYVDDLNGFLMDVCNCLWRSRAFNTTDVNALGCLLPAPLLPKYFRYISSLDSGLLLGSLFSLSCSPVLCLQSISYMRDLEEAAVERTENGRGVEVRARHSGPITALSLKTLAKDGGITLSWPEYRLGVLKYLESKGVNGVGGLMYNTMKHLMQNRSEAPTS